VIRCFQGVDSRQAHLLHQAVLEGLEQPLDAPFCLRTLRDFATLIWPLSIV
jgi:hypothetical protein